MPDIEGPYIVTPISPDDQDRGTADVMKYDVHHPVDGGRFPEAVPAVQPMTEWDPSKVRIVEAYDINWDRMVRRFDYIGPDDKQHYVSQTIKGDDRTLDEMVELLHDHWSKTYA